MKYNRNVDKGSHLISFNYIFLIIIVYMVSFTIVVNELLLSIGFQLKGLLQKIGYKSTIVNDIEKEDPTTIYFIIYYDGLIPFNSIYFQIEQTNYPWFHFDHIKRAKWVMDFSFCNYENYKHLNVIDKTFYLPMPFYFDKNIDFEPTYDIFFYGAKNERREKIMTFLSKKYNVKIGFNTFGIVRDSFIQKSKIIINLHHYEDSCLETCRFNEVLQFNKLVLSEKADVNDYWNEKLYKGLVVFFERDNMEQLCQKIEHYLNPSVYKIKTEYIKQNKYKLMDQCAYFLQKNLFFLGVKPIKYELKDKIYCLTLPETPFRYDAFVQQKLPSLEFYPGIKYNPGWKGCGLSYLNLIYNAKRCGLKQITICEDDCCFKEDFQEKYAIIKEFLMTIPWDIFVGVVADLPEDTILSNVYEYKGITFLELNKMHSMGFNIYNHTCYDRLLKYSIENQIDQFIKHQNFKIIIPFPFEFSCLNITSTISKTNLFDIYNEYFENSNQRILKMLNKTLVLYVFHEYNERVEHFINNCIFKDEMIDFIVICNNDILFKVPDYVKKIIRKNRGYDFGGWSEALFTNDLYKKYKKFIFVNSSVIGPFLKTKQKWTDIYLNGLTDTIKLFGSTINTVHNNDFEPHVQSYIFSMNKTTLDYLIQCEIFSLNYVRTFNDAIHKEISMSKKIIERGWNIGSLLSYYHGVDFCFKAKKTTDYKIEFLGDIMYQKYKDKLWCEYDLVFIKGNRISLN